MCCPLCSIPASDADAKSPFTVHTTYAPSLSSSSLFSFSALPASARPPFPPTLSASYTSFTVKYTILTLFFSYIPLSQFLFYLFYYYYYFIIFSLFLFFIQP